MLLQQLKRLGFSEKESAVYLALVQYGPSPASTLAKRTHLKRTSVYDLLASLQDRTLVNSFKQGLHTYYYVDDLNKLYYEQKNRLEAAQALIETLKTKQTQSPGIQVHHYRGREGYVELYNDILRAKPKDLLGWIHLDHFYEALDPVFEEEWTQKRIKSGIHVRLLMQDTALGREFKSKDATSNRETCLLSTKKFPFKTTCLLYGTTVNFFDTSEDITGIRLHNPALAQMMRQIFEMNWAAQGK